MNTTQQHEYDPRSFTQAEINAGQRKINYALALADQALIDVLVKLKEAIEAPSGKVRTSADDICNAIDKAVKAIYNIMSISPPGCDFTWTPPPDRELSWTSAERHTEIFSENEASQVTKHLSDIEDSRERSSRTLKEIDAINKKTQEILNRLA